MSRFKSVWSDPVWSKVIATALIAVAAAAGAYFLQLWPAIGVFLRSLWGFVTSSTSVSVWLLGVLTIVTCFTAFVIVAAAWSSFRERAQGPAWKSYTTDIFDGLQWYWRYGEDGMIQGLFSCCPKCQYQVHASERGGYTGIHDTSFHCDVCKADIVHLSQGVHSLQDRVVRLIQQKVRTGTWPGAIVTS